MPSVHSVVNPVTIFSVLFLLPPACANLLKNDFCPNVLLNSGEPLDVGCFKTFLGGFHPALPESINTTYLFYTSENVSAPRRHWSYDESFKNESDNLLNSESYLAFIIHGFTSRGDSNWISNMAEALFLRSESEKRHVISVDWSAGAKGPDYAQASRNAFMVGRLTAALIHRLVEKYNLSPDRIHLIGHSLGGHAVGQIIEWLSENFNTKVGRATGLDVAAPGFEAFVVWPNKAYCKFLEVFHTSSGSNPVKGSLGLKENFGHVDFYPNGGVAPQPGCPPPPLKIACSHVKARTLYVEFLMSCAMGCRYVGKSCSSVSEAVKANCMGPTRNICEHVEVLGLNASDSTEEIIYIDAKTQKPSQQCARNFVSRNPDFLKNQIRNMLCHLYRFLGNS